MVFEGYPVNLDIAVKFLDLLSGHSPHSTHGGAFTLSTDQSFWSIRTKRTWSRPLDPVELELYLGRPLIRTTLFQCTDLNNRGASLKEEKLEI